MNQRQLDWILAQGVTVAQLVNPTPVEVFEDCLHFPDWDVFWNPKTNQFIADCWCLGDPLSGFANDPLVIHDTPISWLRASRNGIVVIAWESFFNMVYDRPSIVCPNSLRAKYEKHMKPRLPRVTFA